MLNKNNDIMDPKFGCILSYVSDCIFDIVLFYSFGFPRPLVLSYFQSFVGKNWYEYIYV